MKKVLVLLALISSIGFVNADESSTTEHRSRYDHDHRHGHDHDHDHRRRRRDRDPGDDLLASTIISSLEATSESTSESSDERLFNQAVEDSVSFLAYGEESGLFKRTYADVKEEMPNITKEQMAISIIKNR